MRQLMNITGYSDDVERYESAEELEDFLRKYGLDGVELLDSGAPDLQIFRPRCVCGIHLHQSLSGAFYRKLIETWQPTQGDYYQRMGEVMGHIFQIDTHRPFLSPRIGEILRRVEPEYLTIELISRN